jgi:hypothetical protein
MDKTIFESLLAEPFENTREFEVKTKEIISSELVPKTVLGVDIFEYSKMEDAKQFYVPYIVQNMFDLTIENLLKKESMFFQKKELDEIILRKIDTGDGFFILLDNPLKALIFLFHFCVQIELILTRNSLSGLMKCVNDYTFRYSISTGGTYFYNNKYYGESIIKCSRILSLDKLNRFLIDKESYFWFYNNSDGLDTLRMYTSKKIKEHSVSLVVDEKGKSLIFPEITDELPIINTIIQKIGNVQSKKDIVDVYSVFIQLRIKYVLGDEREAPLVISIGNLNSSGLSTS